MKVSVDNCQSAFNRAHKQVVEYLGGSKTVWDLGVECYPKLTAAWKELHGVDIHWDDDNTKLEFTEGGDFLIFLLRWA